jgi:hypothetical protein
MGGARGKEDRSATNLVGREFHTKTWDKSGLLDLDDVGVVGRHARVERGGVINVGQELTSSVVVAVVDIVGTQEGARVACQAEKPMRRARRKEVQKRVPKESVGIECSAGRLKTVVIWAEGM